MGEEVLGPQSLETALTKPPFTKRPLGNLQIDFVFHLTFGPDTHPKGILSIGVSFVMGS